MNKDELAIKIAEKSGLKKTEALAAINATMETIEEALKKGEKIVLANFGAFSVGYRAARVGVQPGTKNKIQIEDKVSVKFKVGKELEETVNNKTLKTKLSKAKAKKQG